MGVDPVYQTVGLVQSISILQQPHFGSLRFRGPPAAIRKSDSFGKQVVLYETHTLSRKK